MNGQIKKRKEEEECWGGGKVRGSGVRGVGGGGRRQRKVEGKRNLASIMNYYFFYSY
jgi:hypothetical protein